MSAGKFITIEGCEGVGKSTQLKLLEEYCQKNKIDAIFTREPGGTDIAEQIRKIILNPNNTAMDDIAELMLYAASRRQHTYQLILPALKSGKMVFCDRYCDSTKAYQGYARGIDLNIIDSLNAYAMGENKIDATIFIDVDPSVGFSRKGGANSNDRLELENLDFHKRVYEGFKNIAALNKDRVISLAAIGTKFDTHKKIVDVLKLRSIL